jgi:hypothetical protein
MDALPVKRLDVNAGRGIQWSADSTRAFRARRRALHRRPETRLRLRSGDRKDLPKPPESGVKIGFSQKADVPEGIVAITGARIVTMKGDEVIENGTIVVYGEPHHGHRPRADVAVPPQACGRCTRQDHHPRPRRRALARRHGRTRHRSAAKLDRLRLARVRRDHAARPVERHRR